MSLLIEFEERTHILKNAPFQDAGGRLISVLAWLESNTNTQPILLRLKQLVSINDIMKDRRQRARPRTNNAEEIAAVGLWLAENCRSQNVSLWRLLSAIGVRPRSGTNVQDVTDLGMRDYVWPFIDWIRRQIDRIELADRTVSEISMTKPVEKAPDTDENVPDIFISHSSLDERLAKALIGVFEKTFGRVAIRCSSVSGYRFTTGGEYRQQLRLEVERSPIFVALITPAAMRSSEVLFEIGPGGVRTSFSFPSSQREQPLLF